MKARCFSIPVTETGKIQKMASDYLKGDPFFDSLCAVRPTLESFAQLIEQRKSFSSSSREVLASVLREQYDQCGIEDENTFQLIDTLRSADTFTVTTGQQTGILLGPMYTALKILSAISLSRKLKELHPTKNFVPVFWMATEDHDIAEINHAWVKGQKLDWKTEQAGAAGRLSTSDTQDWIKEFAQLAGGSEDAKAIIQLVNNAYSRTNLSEATRILAHGLFGKYGLLVIDADDRRLKQLFAPIITKDILEQVSFHASQQAIEKLESRYSVQVNGREINFFYLSDGSRERIVPSGEGFTTHNGSVNWSNSAELSKEISDYPDRFSPNVMMRPVYQETILPNLAYFGGAAEVAYWLELKPVFDAHQVPDPALLLRNSAMVVDAVNVHRMENGGLLPKDLFDSQVKIEQRAVIQDAQGDLTLKDQKEKLQQWLDELTTRAASISSSMQSSTEAFGVRLLHQTDRLAAKFIREARKHESESLARIRALFTELYPDGKLQERKETIFTYMLLHGSEILDELLECQSPIGNEFIMLMID